MLAELSKRYERAVSGTLSELARGTEAENPRGEYVLVVAPRDHRQNGDVDPEAVQAEYQRALTEGMDRREALRATALRFGIQRRSVFDLVASDPDQHDHD